jgi:hypothetical protein
MDRYYQDLGLQPTATRSEVRKAFLKLSLRYHPDKTLDHDDTMFKKINTAYEVLYKGNSMSASSSSPSSTSTSTSTETSASKPFDYSEYHRRYRKETYSNIIDGLVDEIKSVFPDGISVVRIGMLINILYELVKLSYVVQDQPEIYQKLLSILTHLKSLPVIYLDFSQFDDSGYYINSGSLSNFWDELKIKEHIPYLNMDDVADSTTINDNPFTIFIEELRKKQPKHNITCITSLDWVCHEKSSWFSYVRKMWKVIRASDVTIIEWANQYGFCLASPLSKEDRTKLNDILLGYVV